MSKKQKPVAAVNTQISETHALSLANAGKYKEAIEIYKKLLQNSANSEWQQQLAYCYRHRALALGAKNMYKEALVLWENYSKFARPPYENFDQYVIWQMQAGNQPRILSCLGQLSAQQLDNDYPALAELLGLSILSNHPEYEAALVQDSIFIAHLKTVQGALQAYRENRSSGVETALKALPYRSAFRNFRTLLKAAATLPDAPSEAQALLAKIPADSPYSAAALLLQACFRSGATLFKMMIAMDHSQRKLITEILGLSRKQFELLDALSKLGDRLNDKTKFNLAIQFQSLFGTESAQNFCAALLVDYPAGQRDFAKAFAGIGEFELNRLKALSLERKDNKSDAEFYWHQCIKCLRHESGDSNTKIALILRHIAKGQPDWQQTDTLIESLQYDPEHRDSYLQILHSYSQNQKHAAACQQWLAKSLAKFPQDHEMLTLAMESAVRANNADEAARHASTLLSIDPLNTAAKRMLFSGFLRQARQLIIGKKFDQAEQSLQQAEALKIGKESTLQTQVLRGFLCFAGQNKQQGLEQIRDVLQKAYSDPVNAHFHAAIEALLTKQALATILRELPPLSDHVLPPQELTRFLDMLTHYAQQNPGIDQLHKALEKVKGALKKSLLEHTYDEKLVLLLCQTLDSIQHFELLRHCSKQSQLKKPSPILMYYRIYSETNGLPEKCSITDRLCLKENLVWARQDGDHRAAMLIDDYLQRYYEKDSANMDFLESLLGTTQPDNSQQDPFDQLFGHLPDEIFYKLEKRLTPLFKKTSPERLLKELSLAGGNNHKIMQAIMQDPDIFTALMMVKAAEELGLNIDVSLQDVLACYGLQ